MDKIILKSDLIMKTRVVNETFIFIFLYESIKIKYISALFRENKSMSK